MGVQMSARISQLTGSTLYVPGGGHFPDLLQTGQNMHCDSSNM